MIFVILIYDVDSNSKQGIKLLKIARRYLHQTQKSCFEGYISHKKIQKLKSEINYIDDGMIKLKIYELNSVKYLKETTYGNMNKSKNIF